MESFLTKPLNLTTDLGLLYINTRYGVLDRNFQSKYEVRCLPNSPKAITLF